MTPSACAVLVLNVVHVLVSPAAAAREHLGLGPVAVGAGAGRGGHDLAVLVDELEVVPAQEVRYGGQLGAVPGGVVVEFEQGHGEKLHVLGDA